MGQTDFSDTIWNPEHLCQEGQIQRSCGTCVTAERCPDHSLNPTHSCLLGSSRRCAFIAIPEQSSLCIYQGYWV